MPDLRPYQIRAVDAVRRHIQQGSRSPLLVAPTGAGKTVILSHITASAVAKGRRVVIVAHRAELLNQIIEALRAVLIDPGIIAPWARPNPFRPVQVASVQTLARRDTPIKCDLLIVDEAHHTTASNQWGQVIARLAPRHILGLTATPLRTDGQGLGVEAGGIYDAMEVVTTTLELVEAGYLARPVVYAPRQRVDLGGVKMRGGDYDHKSLAGLMKGQITGDAVAEYGRRCPGAAAVAFGVSLDHCNDIATQFNEAGIAAEVIDGTQDHHERAMILNRLRAKVTRVVVSCDLIGEGFDLPAIETAILLRPTISTALYLQQVGRALRLAPGKERATILDHAGNALRHGLPTDEREWSLAGEDDAKRAARRKADPDAAPVWQCCRCYAYTPSGEPECEECGLERPAPRAVTQVAGDLVEVTTPPARRDPERAGARSLADLQRIEKARGYKAGWANHVWRARMARMEGKG